MEDEKLPEESSLPEKKRGKEETKDAPPQTADSSKEEEYQRLVNVALFAATRWDTI